MGRSKSPRGILFFFFNQGGPGKEAFIIWNKGVETWKRRGAGAKQEREAKEVLEGRSDVPFRGFVSSGAVTVGK